MSVILGIDPGSRNTGYAALRRVGRSLDVIDSGVIKLPSAEALAVRLGVLATRLDEIVARVAPDVVAVEDVFTSLNARSALKLGQARGAVLATVGRRGLEVCAYPPASVKRAVAGNGRADKRQIQRMVQTMLGLQVLPAVDEADAMALAICHSMSSGARALLEAAR